MSVSFGGASRTPAQLSRRPSVEETLRTQEEQQHSGGEAGTYISGLCWRWAGVKACDLARHSGRRMRGRRFGDQSAVATPFANHTPRTPSTLSHGVLLSSRAVALIDIEVPSSRKFIIKGHLKRAMSLACRGAATTLAATSSLRLALYGPCRRSFSSAMATQMRDGKPYLSHIERTAAEPREAGFHPVRLSRIDSINANIRLLRLSVVDVADPPKVVA